MRLINADKLMEGLTVDPYLCPGCPEPEELVTLLDTAEDATVEEIKEAAKEMGYKLIPAPTLERLKTCVCGGKRRERWYKDACVILVCKRCGREVNGTSEADARRNWNAMVEGERGENAKV